MVYFFFFLAHWLFNMETLLVQDIKPFIFLHEGHDMNLFIGNCILFYSLTYFKFHIVVNDRGNLVWWFLIFSQATDCQHARVAIWAVTPCSGKTCVINLEEDLKKKGYLRLNNFMKKQHFIETLIDISLALYIVKLWEEIKMEQGAVLLIWRTGCWSSL